MNLYYVLEYQLDQFDCSLDILETNGWKEIRVYEIVNEELREWFVLDIENTTNTKEAIQKWLSENSDIVWNLVQL